MDDLVKREQEVQINPEALIRAAIEKALPVETMERLLAMRKQLKDEWAREQFYISLAKFQKKTPAIKKTKDVHNSEAKGGGYRYSYAPLETIVEQVKDALKVNGFSYTLKTKQDAVSMTVICEAHHRDGHTESTEVTVPIKAEYMTAQQVVGSAITYAKRYAFCNAFGIMTADEDNDGEGVDEPKGKQPEAQPAKKPEATEPPCYATLRKILTEITQGMTTEQKAKTWDDTCMRVLGKSKKKVDYLTVPECETMIMEITAGGKK